MTVVNNIVSTESLSGDLDLHGHTNLTRFMDQAETSSVINI